MKLLPPRAAISADLPGLATWLGRPVALPTAAGEHLLVLEAAPDAATASDGATTLAATLRLVPAIGLALPRLWYRVGTAVHAARELGLFHQQRTLLLGHDLTGASELTDVAWDSATLGAAQPTEAIATLVRAALSQLAAERRLHRDTLICELPGPRDASGTSPFWQGLGRHFYGGDTVAALQAHGPAWRTHVAALMPRQLLYASFLSAPAQAAIGAVAAAALPLQQALIGAGFRSGAHINLEDGGPVCTAVIDDLLAR